MNDRPFAPILTERLKLAPLRLGDVDEVVAILGDPAVARHSPGLAHPYSPAMARAWIGDADRRMLGGREFVFGCRTARDGQLVGIAKLALEPAGPSAEVAYWIKRSCWGEGYASEVARRMVALGFDTLGLDRIWGAVLDANPASRRVLENSGLRVYGETVFDGRAAQVLKIEAADFVATSIFPVLYVAAAALIDDEGRVLLAQRPPGKTMAGLWEFPGGKIEPGERPDGALARELAEELALHVALADFEPLSIASHHYDDFHLLMPLLMCRRWGGEPLAREGQTLAWATPATLAAYDMPPADIPLVGELVALLSP